MLITMEIWKKSVIFSSTNKRRNFLIYLKGFQKTPPYFILAEYCCPQLVVEVLRPLVPSRGRCYLIISTL